CLEQIEQHVRPAMHVLDVGTGSGILALAAAKLGAAYVYALDNDSVAVESATSNVAMNELEERVKVMLGVLDEQEAVRMGGKYDLVAANIIAHVIGLLAPQLARVLAPNGLLIVSGIVEARLHDALDPLLAQELEVIDRVMIDDWITLILRKQEH
ncbi:MAG: 50S ribosomal protein L11 methyltransferase, partial [Ktedonobacteraceae bacterium]|nr:50S ribosomal protein L11 methyltransferase [Ktedonobacteraceae bacterium]